MATSQFLKPHVSLNVRDLKKSVAFYSKLFRLEPARLRENYAKFDVAEPPLNLALNAAEFCCDAAPACCTGALSHLGLQVKTTEDVATIRNQWEEAGLLPRDENQTECCYALQNKAWVKDPDGNEWEVFVVLSEVPQDAGGKDRSAKNKSGNACAPNACAPRSQASANPETAHADEDDSGCCGVTSSACCSA